MKSIILAALLLCGWLASTRAADLPKLVAELGSVDYRTRDAASQQLASAGARAIDAVARAAEAEDLEVAYRAVRVLQAMLESPDEATQQQAEAALTALTKNAVGTTADLAQDAIAMYRHGQQDRIVAKLRGLGAMIYGDDPENSDGLGLQVHIGTEWKGEPRDWQLLKLLPSLDRLSVRNVKLDAAAAAVLKELPPLSSMELYGTDISPEATEQIARAMPGTKIDRRNGALLGVGGTPGLVGCQINVVQPGSAAAEAGLEVEDEIVAFNGQPVQNFEELTALISTKKGGDQVALKIRRGDEVLEKKVKLGQWE